MSHPQPLHPDVVRLLRSLLDVIDNLERALDAAATVNTGGGAAGSEPSPFEEGVRGIHRQLSDLIYRYDLRAFSSQGVRFDPSRHEAMGQIHTDEVPPQHVAQEVRRGYVQGDILFRAAQVIVAAEPTLEQPAVSPDLLSGTGGVRRSAAAPERSAPNRPSWLLDPPESTETVLHTVGRISAAPSVDEGQRRARNEALRRLLAQLPGVLPEDRLRPAVVEVARSLEGRADEDIWKRLNEYEYEVEVKGQPEPKRRQLNVERWVDDLYWEQVRGEIRGRSFDVALLLAVDVKELTAMLPDTGRARLERWAGLELADLGRFFDAIGQVEGALIVDIQGGGVGARSGFKPGDVITRVGMRPVDDAASARRLLNLQAKQRRPFEVELSRAFGPMVVLRVEPGLRR